MLSLILIDTFPYIYYAIDILHNRYIMQWIYYVIDILHILYILSNRYILTNYVYLIPSAIQIHFLNF